MPYRLLEPDDEAAIEELLLDDPEANLFLLGLLDEPVAGGVWAGAFEGDQLQACAVGLGSLVVPAARASGHGASLARLLQDHIRPELLVGPRAVCDEMLEVLANRPWKRCLDQRLYVLHKPPAHPGTIEPATAPDQEEVARLGEAMNLEDLGRQVQDRTAHLLAVRQRIDQGRTFVARDRGQIVFTVNVGTRTTFGCQIGGTYVPPEARGRGYATRGLAALCRLLLQRFPCITLHVNEANLPAVALYERLGFVRATPFRLVTW